LRGTGYPGARELGSGIGYKYPHDYPGNYIEQEYLPQNLKGVSFYKPTENGFEQVIKTRMKIKIDG